MNPPRLSRADQPDNATTPRNGVRETGQAQLRSSLSVVASGEVANSDRHHLDGQSGGAP
jgi:hypothetical protein